MSSSLLVFEVYHEKLKFSTMEKISLEEFDTWIWSQVFDNEISEINFGLIGEVVEVVHETVVHETVAVNRPYYKTSQVGERL